MNEQQLNQEQHIIIPERFMPVPFFDGLEEIRNDLKIRTATGSKTYGIEILDDGCEFIRPGTVTLIMACPNVGKSLLAQNIATHLAKQGEKVLFSSCEMSPGLLMERELKKTIGVSAKQLLDGYKQSPTAVNSTLDSIPENPDFDYINNILIQDIGGIDVDTLIETYNQNPEYKYIIVDYIQRIKGNGSSEYEQLKDVSYKLQIYAMETRRVIIECSQIPKSNENDSRSMRDNMVNFTTLKAKGAGNMEEDAHVAIKMAEFRDDTGRYVLINLSKNKYGTLKDVTYKYLITPRLEFKLISKGM